MGSHINGHGSVSNKVETLTGIVNKCGLGLQASSAVWSWIGSFGCVVRGPHANLFGV